MKCKRPSCTEEARDNPHRGHVPLYCSVKCKNIDKVNDFRRNRKQVLVDLMGGSCRHCGYDKYLGALQFHHTDPSQKDFQLNRALTLSLDKVRSELDKCILLCANCHMEEHDRLRIVSQGSSVV